MADRKQRLYSALATSFVACICLTQFAGCSTIRFGGKSAHQVFSDPGEAAMAEAGCSGNTKKMDVLAKSGVNVNAVGTEGGTVLFWVMGCGNFVGFEKMLELGANPNYKTDDGDSVTWLAAGADNPKYLSLVLNHGGDPDIWGIADRNALMIAEQYGREKNIQLLLDHGADVNNHNSSGDSVAQDFIIDRRFDLLIEILDRGFNYDLLTIAHMMVNTKTEPGSKNSILKSKILDMLKQRGVSFPLKPYGS